MKVLLLGSGGRESALAWKMHQSPLLDKLFIAPGNGGTDAYGTNVPSLSPLDFPAIEEFVKANDIDMIVVGNEDPLVAGIFDYFAEQMPQLLVVARRRPAHSSKAQKISPSSS